MDQYRPSSKITAGGAVGLVVAAILYAAGVAGVEVVTLEPAEFPAVAVTLLMSLAAGWLKRENRPSPSAREAVAAGR